MIESITYKPKPKFYTLNALRGYSAIFVVFYHMIENGQYLDPHYWPGWFKYFYDKEHMRVLIFFVISGTVIQLSNKVPLTLKTIPEYFKKRAIRIYPIYFISLVAALIVTKVTYSYLTIAGNFTFLQVLFTDVILANGPVWTLHFEVLFYFLFVPISVFNISPSKVFIFSVILGFVNFFVYPAFGFVIITAYCFGFAFWIMGSFIVKHFPVDKDRLVNNRKLVSFLFLISALPYLNELSVLIYEYSMKWYGKQLLFDFGGDINNWFKTAFTVYDFPYLPYCFMAIIIFTNRTVKYKTLIFWILQLFPLFSLYSTYDRTHKIDVLTMAWPLTCYAASLLLLFTNFNIIERIATKIINFLVWMGGVSYGMYIIHGPILALFNRINFMSGTHTTFLIRMLGYFVLTFICAYLLEKKFHQWVTAYFNKAKKQQQPEQPVPAASDLLV